MRIGLAKFTQAFLVGLSVLVGLNAAGLDLTTLNVLTGAIGIGLGFGLQSIAANFVSGFVLLMDRSIKPGDVISFTGTTGTSTEGFGWVAGAARPLRRRARPRRRRDPGAEPEPDHELGHQLELHRSARAAQAADPRQLQGRSRTRDARCCSQATDGHRRSAARAGPGRAPDELRRPRHRARAAVLDSPTRRTASTTCAPTSIAASGACSRSTASRSRSRSARSARDDGAGRSVRALRREPRRCRACRRIDPATDARDPGRAARVSRQVRASGPGGQNVNKVSNASSCASTRHASGCLVARRRVPGSPPRGPTTERRGRDRDRRAAFPLARAEQGRCAGPARGDGRGALVEPKPRKKTRPTRASRERRLPGKVQRGRVKTLRRKEFDD